MKVSELKGVELDYWVARAEGIEPQRIDMTEHDVEPGEPPYVYLGCGYSRQWDQGGRIIERELIELTHDRDYREDGTFGRVWQANVCGGWWDGDTPLIAAMRAYVASKFGEEVPEVSQKEDA